MSCIIDCDTETDDPAASRPVSSESSARPSMPPGLSSSAAPPSQAHPGPSLANTSFGPIHPRRVALLPSPPVAAAVAASASADYHSRGRGRGYWRGRGGRGRGRGGYGGYRGAGRGSGRGTGRGGRGAWGRPTPYPTSVVCLQTL